MKTQTRHEMFMEAVDSAYQKLPPNEAETIDDQCTTLMRNMRTKKKAHGKSALPPQFGFVSALELVAKLGIFLEGKVVPNPAEVTTDDILS